MKRIISITSIVIVTVALLCGCVDRLDKAIQEGYKTAFDEAEAKEEVRLSEYDYNNICSWFETYAEEQNNLDYNDTLYRWNYIRSVLSEKYDESEINRIDSTQWLGSTEALPLIIDVYLDNTSSMKGYIKHQHVNDKVFVNVFHAIDDYLFRSEEEAVVKSYYTQRNKNTRKDEIVELAWDGDGGMKDQLDHNRMTGFTDSYKLNDFLERIATRMEDDKGHRHLSFFITDGIPSGPNEKVKPGGTWNIDHATELQNQIRLIARNMVSNDGGISIYQFNGEFYGEGADKDCFYWYHDNSTKLIQPSKKINRPFYVIVMGDAEMTEHFKHEVGKGLLHFNPSHQVHYKKMTDDLCISVVDDNKNVAEYSNDEYLFSNMDEKKLKIYISIPIGTLPSFIVGEDKLTNVITLKIDDKEYGNCTVKEENIEFGPILLEKNTRIDAEITVRNNAPTWTKVMNVLDDKKEGCEKGTFNFLVLVDGLREGYFGNEDILFKKSFSVKRDN